MERRILKNHGITLNGLKTANLFLKATILCFSITISTELFSQPEKIKIKHKLSSQIGYSPWGVQFNPVAPHIDLEIEKVNNQQVYNVIDSLLGDLNESGSKWVRFSVNWNYIQDPSGNFYWTYSDKVIKGLHKRGISIIVCLNGGNKPLTRNASIRGEKEMEYWLTFVDSLSRRYSKEVKYYELWNEPNTVWFWQPSPKASEYFELVKQSSSILRKNVPGVKVIGGSLARLDLPFADTLARMGIHKYIDVFSIHPYNEFPEAIFKKINIPVKTPTQYIEADHQISELKKLFTGTNVRIWQDECGYASTANSLGWTGNGPWGDSIQSKWILRRMMTDMITGSDISCYFSLYEFREGNPNKYNSKGLLKLGTLEKKLSFYTFRNMASIFSDSVSIPLNPVFKVIEKITEGIFFNFNPDEVMGYYMKCRNMNCFSYWLPWRMQEIIKPAKISIQISNITDPVLVDMIKGTVKPLYSKPAGPGLIVIKNVPLTDYPIFIMERNMVIGK